jgi:hypothetical protein
LVCFNNYILNKLLIIGEEACCRRPGKAETNPGAACCATFSLLYFRVGPYLNYEIFNISVIGIECWRRT